MPSTTKMTFDDLEKRSPSSLQHARNILSAAHKDILKQLENVEKAFYGSKNCRAEVGRRARMVTKLMKIVNLSFLIEPRHMEALAARAAYHDESDLTPQLKQVREIYEKTWKYVPGEIRPILNKIDQIVRYQKMYCPAVYEPAIDPFIQVASDYQIKLKAWLADIKKYLNHVNSLQERFQKGALYLDEMSQNTRELAMKVEAEDCPFVFAFFEACEIIREIVKNLGDWLTVANEYAHFLNGEMEELQQMKVTVQQKALKQQDQYNKENYRLMILKQELETRRSEQAALQSKEMEMLVREELLNARVNEMKIDFDIKEFRLAEMHRTINPKTATLAAIDGMNKLAEEVRVEGQELNDIHKELALIKLKMSQVIEKQDTCRKMADYHLELEEQVKTIHRTYINSSKELNRLTHTVEHIKYMIQYLTTPDTAQKIFLDLPRRREALGVSRAHGLNISSSGDDMMDQVFDVLAPRLGTRWISIYRQLPFYPPRGQKTIEDDIRSIQVECVRDSQDKEVRKSLERWRRFHTRARPAELLEVVKGLGDEEISRAIDKIVNPPRPKTPVVETFPAFLDESLIPYYQAVSRYDSVRLHKKENPVK